VRQRHKQRQHTTTTTTTTTTAGCGESGKAWQRMLAELTTQLPLLNAKQCNVPVVSPTQICGRARPGWRSSSTGKSDGWNVSEANMNKREDDEMSERQRGWKRLCCCCLPFGHPAELRWISKCLSCAFETQSLSGYTAVTRCVADGGHLARMQGTTTDETVAARSLGSVPTISFGSKSFCMDGPCSLQTTRMAEGPWSVEKEVRGNDTTAHEERAPRSRSWRRRRAETGRATRLPGRKPPNKVGNFGPLSTNPARSLSKKSWRLGVTSGWPGCVTPQGLGSGDWHARSCHGTPWGRGGCRASWRSGTVAACGWGGCIGHDSRLLLDVSPVGLCAHARPACGPLHLRGLRGEETV
jgi:hypothetical protein